MKVKKNRTTDPNTYRIAMLLGVTEPPLFIVHTTVTHTLSRRMGLMFGVLIMLCCYVHIPMQHVIPTDIS